MTSRSKLVDSAEVAQERGIPPRIDSDVLEAKNSRRLSTMKSQVCFSRSRKRGMSPSLRQIRQMSYASYYAESGSQITEWQRHESPASCMKGNSGIELQESAL